MTGGGFAYHELSAQAFAQLIGSNAKASSAMRAEDFQKAINDPGRPIMQLYPVLYFLYNAADYAVTMEDDDADDEDNEDEEGESEAATLARGAGVK
ncbi:hypothetical protein HDU77_011730 [Chytriomyces hyalinus]|nr:hypothetical protein HDU77_011730 [Chytriomyces hyalinus]